MANKGKNMNLAITVDDGSRRVPIINKDGEEIGFFRFHPTDIGIIKRYNELAANFDTIIDPLQAISGDADGAAEVLDARQMEALQEAESRLYAAVNKLFGGDMAGAFFGSMHPFSPVNGAFYCEQALQAVGEFISAQFDAETAKMSKRVEKYTKAVR